MFLVAGTYARGVDYRGLASYFSDEGSVTTEVRPPELQSAEVVALAIKVFGKERIMFGSDKPLSLIRSVAYEHPQKGQRIVTDYPYHWVDGLEFQQYGHLAADAIHSHWQSVLAIKSAIDNLPQGEQTVTKEWLFHKTAGAVYGF